LSEARRRRNLLAQGGPDSPTGRACECTHEAEFPHARAAGGEEENA
jgi:hypothetical protein